MMDRGWRTVVVVAGGPSLDANQAAIITQAQREGRCRVIVINESWRMIPGADVLYFGDGDWLRAVEVTPPDRGALVTPGMRTIDALRVHFHGELWTQDHAASVKYGLHWIESVAGAGIHPDPGKVYAGANSGHAGACLAQRFGALTLPLVAFDMKFGPNKEAHWHGRHPEPLGNGNPKGFIKHFNTLAPQLAAAGIRVLNCSRETALTCFERADLAEALKEGVAA